MRSIGRILAAAVLALAAAGGQAAEPSLRVLATTTDLRDVAREVGGDDVAVTCLMKGPEDPHYLEARPSFVRAAAEADVLLVTGMELEVGYEPLLRTDSRNPRIQHGKPGYVDCSVGISPLDVPVGPVDRSHGDIHAAGNPHYMCDPVRAKVVAGTVAEAFAAAAPHLADGFRARRDAFRRRVDVAMFGEAVLAEQSVERLERKLSEGTLAAWAAERGIASKLGGWAKDLLPHAGRGVVAYHGNFRYLLDRFAMREAANIEPKPGVEPSPKHLAGVVAAMKRDGVRVVVHSACQPAATARSVAESAGGVAVLLAHQPGARDGADDLFAAWDGNVRALRDALAQHPAEAK
ncbi:MAG: putative metal ABC transporter substrate-binding protein Hpf [Planctomycetes bacterium]|nr:putative metal ABC transporter substrate-binding protein Hpf [Planctomycetota bacterium]